MTLIAFTLLYKGCVVVLLLVCSLTHLETTWLGLWFPLVRHQFLKSTYFEWFIVYHELLGLASGQGLIYLLLCTACLVLHFLTT